MTNILGRPCVADAQALGEGLARLGSATPVPPTPGWIELAQLYLEEGAAEGVAGDLALCQAVHETGWFRFGGDVKPSQHNYAGLGATGGGAGGAQFPDPRTGIRAQVQHLKRYASDLAPANPVVDPRFGFVTPGSCPTWESLDGHWAVPGIGYGEAIVALRDQIAQEVAPVSVPAPLQVDNEGRIVGPNVSWGAPFPTPNGSWNFQEPAWGMASHTEVGWEHSVNAEFEDPNSQASSFCSIGFDGHITQYGPIGKGWMAWTQAAGNPHYRGIEHEDGGDPMHPYTAEQVASSAQLLELFSRVDGFPIQPTDDPNGGKGNIFHSDGGGAWGGHDCPGDVRRAQRPLVVALAVQIRAASGGLVVGGDEDMAQGYMTVDPQTGGTWTVLCDDGEVDTADGAPYLGGQNNHPEWHSMDATHPIVGIAAWRDPQGQWGYKIGELWPEAPAGQGRVRYYRFPRDGSLAHAPAA